MSPIRVPRNRAYYLTSPNEKDRLLLWIPKDELKAMVEEGRLPEAVLADFPRGLEVEVTSQGFEHLQIDLGIDPEAISTLYRYLSERGKVPDSGVVDGAALEHTAREILEGVEEPDTKAGTFTPEFLETRRGIAQRRLPEPEMTDGEEPMLFLRRLS
jgi:hypothetical protein